MTTSILSGILMLALAASLAGCDADRGPTAPSGSRPSPPQPTPPPTLLVFADASSGFSTSDLRDAQDQIVQFNSASELIWVADGTRLPGYRAQGIYISCGPCGGELEVRFGTKDGERRAYLTVDYGHDNPGSLIDLEVAGGVLTAKRSDVFPPGTYTLSGLVTEVTPTGPVPLEGVKVYRGYATGWIEVTTDGNGFYAVYGLYDREDDVSASKDGYISQSTRVAVNGNTRFDMQLVRK